MWGSGGGGRVLGSIRGGGLDVLPHVDEEGASCDLLLHCWSLFVPSACSARVSLCSALLLGAPASSHCQSTFLLGLLPVLPVGVNTSACRRFSQHVSPCKKKKMGDAFRLHLSSRAASATLDLSSPAPPPPCRETMRKGNGRTLQIMTFHYF